MCFFFFWLLLRSLLNSFISVQLGEDPRFVRTAARLAQIFSSLAAHHHWYRSRNKLLPGPRVDPWGIPLGITEAPKVSSLWTGFILLFEFMDWTLVIPHLINWVMTLQVILLETNDEYRFSRHFDHKCFIDRLVVLVFSRLAICHVKPDFI